MPKPLVSPAQQLLAWVALWLYEAFGADARWELAEPISHQAERLGWLALLERLLPLRPEPPGQGRTPVAAVLPIALEALARTIPFEQAGARVAALGLCDFDRALLCLFAYHDTDLTGQGGHVGVIRLMADGALDDEFAARAYWTLGRAMRESPDWAVHAFEAGLARLKDEPPPALPDDPASAVEDGPAAGLKPGAAWALKAGLALDFARCQQALGQAELAAQAADRAAAWAGQAGDDATEASARLLQAMVLLERGRPVEAAAALADLAVRRAPPGGILPDDDVVATVLTACVDHQLDALFPAMLTAAVPDAAARLEAALACPGTHAFRYPREAERRVMLARLLAAHGDAPAALAQAVRAVQVLAPDRLPEAFLRDQLMLGTQLLAAGWVTEVEALVSGLLAVQTPGWPDVETGQLALLQATALQKGGAYDVAEARLEALLAKHRQAGRAGDAAAVAYVLGENALLQRCIDQGRTWYEQALAGAAQQGNALLQGAALNKLGTIWMQLNEPARGLAAHEQALVIHRDAQAWTPLVVDLIQAAQSCLMAGRLERAVELAAELARLGPQYPPEDPEWVPLTLARVAAARGSWSEARPLFAQALAIIEQRRRMLPTPEAQRTWSLQKADSHGFAIEAAIVAGAGEDAIVFLEQGRHRYLRALAARQLPEPEPDWPTLAAALPDGVTAVWFGVFAGGFGVVAARRQADESMHAVARHEPQLGRAVLQPLIEGDLPRLVDAQRAGGMVEFLQQSLAEARPVTLGADAYWQPYGSLWEAGLAQACEVLGQRVWPLLRAAAAAVGATDDADLMLLPSVGCSELPVAAAVPDAAPGQAQPGLCVMPSLSAWAGERRHAPRPAAAVLSLAQVVNANEDPHLCCSTTEAALCARAFGRPVQRLPGRRARRERVLEALATSDVVHFIGHAFVDWQDPLDSGLVCAPQGDDDGVLTVRQILARVGEVRSRVVILSACQIGNVPKGDRQNEFLNLPGALVAAGAALVLAPRWQVQDVPTALLLTRTLTEWFAGARLPRALAEAGRWLRDAVTTDGVVAWLEAAADDPAADRDGLLRLAEAHRQRHAANERPYAHPRHWGAFELTGHPG